MASRFLIIVVNAVKFKPDPDLPLQTTIGYATFGRPHLNFPDHLSFL